MEKFLQARNRVGAIGSNTQVHSSASNDTHGPITPKSGSSGEKSAEMEAKLYQALKIVFGFQEFRPQQLNIVKQILLNKDVFVVMPTVCVYFSVCLLIGRTNSFGDCICTYRELSCVHWRQRTAFLGFRLSCMSPNASY
jgi:hypothetical protein